MAVKIVRKRRKNADGSYDIVHYETQAKAVWMSDGRSVEEAVAAGNGSPGNEGSLVVTGSIVYEDGEYFTVNNISHTLRQVISAIEAGTAVSVILIQERSSSGYLSNSQERLTLTSIQSNTDNTEGLMSANYLIFSSGTHQMAWWFEGDEEIVNGHYFSYL